MATPRVPILKVDNLTYQALRRYFAKHDIDAGRGYPYVWDLRSGAANRWPDEFDPRDPARRHIHYTVAFERSDMSQIEEIEYAQKHGEWPRAPEAWEILWEEGTFQGEWNPAHERWAKRARPHLRKTESAFNRWLKKNPAPPERLPSPYNWTPKAAFEELERVIPEAVRQLVEEDPGALEWEPRRFILPAEGFGE